MSSKSSDNGGAKSAPRLTGGNPPAPPAAESTAPAADQTGSGDTAVADKPSEMTAGATPTHVTLEQAQKMAADAADAAIARMLERQAKNRPVNLPHDYEAESTTGVKVFDMPVSGNLDDAVRTDLFVEQADPMAFESHAAELAFQNEVLKVVVAESTNPNDQAVFPLSINGVTVWVKRGEVMSLRRCFVELLFRAKPQAVKVAVGKDANGEVVNRTTKTSALAFPFNILHDPSPRAAQWRAKLSREG